MNHALHVLRNRLTALVILLVIMTAIGPAAMAAAWQETEPEVSELAAPPPSEQAWSVLGRGQTTDDLVTVAGWLTAVSGLDPARLALGDDAASGGRFTFVADIAIDRTSNRGSVVTNWGQGSLIIYLLEGTTPTEDDLTSFRSDVIVAAYAAEFQVTSQGESPGQGVVTGRMSLTQTEALTFDLDDERFRFGHAGAELALTLTGGLAANASDADTIETSYFGAARVISRSANPTGTGDATAGDPELTDCEQLVAWIEGTRARLVAAGDLRATILSGDEVSESGLADAFATVSTLLDEQRAEIGPEPSAGAARLALTVLNTDARGIELLITATSAGNQPAVDQALTILADGDALAGRALSSLDEITPTCEPSA